MSQQAEKQGSPGSSLALRRDRGCGLERQGSAVRLAIRVNVESLGDGYLPFALLSCFRASWYWLLISFII